MVETNLQFNEIMQDEINHPQGATHVIFKSGLAVVDFETGSSAMAVSTAQRLEVAASEQTITLAPDELPVISGTKLLLLSIEFVQEVNGTDYSLKNGAYNALAIVELV